MFAGVQVIGAWSLLVAPWTVRLARAALDASVLRWAIETCRSGDSAGCLRVVEHDAELPVTPVDAERVYRDACGAGHAAACERLSGIVQVKNEIVRAIVDAVANGDVAALAKRLGAQVDSSYGLDFADPACTKQFSIVTLAPEHHAGLLNCLAAASAHVSPSPDPQHASSLAFDTDGTIDIVVRDGAVQAIHSLPRQLRAPMTRSPSGAPARTRPAPVLSLTQEPDRIAGDTVIVPDDRMRAELDARRTPVSPSSAAAPSARSSGST